MAARFAVYWVPEATHELWSAGCRWLGRDPALAEPGSAPVFARSPWRYGFHATLKPPMALRAPEAEAGFVQAVQRLAADTADFDMPALQVAWLGDFLALRPVQALAPDTPLRRLADACVRELDPWRAPEAPEAVAARRAKTASAAQRLLLDRWGYPHVFEHWRFHMSLSDPNPPAPQRLAEQAARHFEAALAAPMRAGGLALFHEAAPGQPLRLLLRCRFGPPRD